jgi:hypothetical protein
MPAEPPEARRPAGPTALAGLQPGEKPGAIAPSGQTITALARIPQVRPALAGHDAVEVIAVWPELKPDGLSAIKEAAGPPQPELKPKGP